MPQGQLPTACPKTKHLIIASPHGKALPSPLRHTNLALLSRVRHARSCCHWHRSMLPLPAGLKRFMDEGKHLTVDQMPQMESPPELGLAQMPQPLLQAPRNPQGLSPFQSLGAQGAASSPACLHLGATLQRGAAVHFEGQTWEWALPAAVDRGLC